MIPDILQKRTAHSWYVCQKCKSPGGGGAAEVKPLVIVPKQLILLCEDCLLQYCMIFPIEDREFVRDGYDERYR
jgi:hypothetical protein